MKENKSNLSEALLIYVGWNTNRSPCSNELQVIDKFGDINGNSLIEDIQAIFHEVSLIPIDWSRNTLVSAGQIARNHAHNKYPDLSEDALKAVEWKFTFDWR
jgi:hypothetical protein